jgi:DNA-binding NarL/FixJ family response regulator
VSTRSPSPNAHANSGRGARIGVRIAISDPDLAAKVREELERSAVLIEAGRDAVLSLTDRAMPSSTVTDMTALSGKRPRLSPREVEVVGLLLEGASNKAIARRLDISIHTAKFHVTQILDKLDAQNRADAVSIILRDGLVTL